MCRIAFETSRLVERDSGEAAVRTRQPEAPAIIVIKAPGGLADQ